MFVASRVNFEGDDKAVVAVPAEVIGYIQTVIGCSIGDGHNSNSEESNKYDSGHKHGGGVLDFEPASIAHEVFGTGAAGKFGLGDSFHFKGKISGSSDVTNLVDLDHTPASFSHHGSGKGTSGPLAIFEEAIDLYPSSHHLPLR